jgi:hypothetical protein
MDSDYEKSSSPNQQLSFPQWKKAIENCLIWDYKQTATAAHQEVEADAEEMQGMYLAGWKPLDVAAELALNWEA